ncbi:hypothetical protein Slala03_69990 [Streptomyces lavendulae subsp. lavendulae]|nr:hypothetical protein Slala03_69990 [Streptomyces lavendulae subsp. lavendulae]
MGAWPPTAVREPAPIRSVRAARAAGAACGRHSSVTRERFMGRVYGRPQTPDATSLSPRSRDALEREVPVLLRVLPDPASRPCCFLASEANYAPGRHPGDYK